MFVGTTKLLRDRAMIKTSPKTNQTWLDSLQGPERDEALTELRALLTRGLTYAMRDRTSVTEADVEDFVQDALLKILDNLETFRGESRFTTWANKIAIHVALSELRRRRWKDVSLQDLMPQDAETDFVPAIAADPGPLPERRGHAMDVDGTRDAPNRRATSRPPTTSDASRDDARYEPAGSRYADGDES